MRSRANNTTSAALIIVIIKTGEQYNICRIETNGYKKESRRN